MVRASIIVGIERDGQGVQLPVDVRANALKAVRDMAARRYGGYTLSNAAGGWVNSDGLLIEEGALRIDLFTDEPFARVRAFTRDVGALFNQAAVILDYHGSIDFVEMDGGAVRVGEPQTVEA